ncbi:MAG: carbon monoxide dehydrogenase subunit G [Burkholderiales bacterium]|nr:carbon monoxide dehydrogenase subunit G [Burkholderiales bacterium]
MNIEGSKTIAADRQTVWQALNDPAFLQRAIPGCSRLVERSPQALEATISTSLGPIRAGFDVQLEKRDVIEGRAWSLHGGGSAGAIGSASGVVNVTLEDLPGGTQLNYVAQTEITGRLAQLGTRLIDSTARRFSEEFFSNASRLLAEGAAGKPASATGAAVAGAHAPHIDRLAAPSASHGASPWRLMLASAIGAFLGAFAALWLR